MATIRYLNQRLASQAAIRQVESLLMAERAADALDVRIHRTWRWLFAISGSSASEAHGWIQRRIIHMLEMARETTIARLTAIAQWAYRHTARQTVATLPIGLLQAAVMLKGSRPRSLATREADVLMEAEPGLSRLLFDLIGLRTIDLAAPFRTPQTITDDQQRELFQSLLFPAPPETAIRSWVSRLIPPPVNGHAIAGQIADLFSASFAAGKAPREIAKDILPLVDNIRTSARRTARTWGQYVAHKAQQQAHDQLDDLTIGSQIHATLDQNTRPAHRFRNGTIYYKRPKPGQKDMDEAPDPPLEADGSIAFN